MIPLRTDIDVRRTPYTNYVLVVVNVLVFLVLDVWGGRTLGSFKHDVLALWAELPAWWQFFTYQFIHGDTWHLAGNMIFLWVFGNAVNGKMGHLPYLCFYLAGGAFAGWGFALTHDNLLMGASGAIAAVTTAFMVLYPRSHILFLFMFFIITTISLPSLYVILFKIVLWDNILVPAMSPGPSQVAFGAHLYGYFYGFAVTLALLLLRALQRDQFDLLAIIKRWRQRRTYADLMRNPEVQARAQFGNVARPVSINPQKQRALQARLDRVTQLREEIQQALAGGNDETAMSVYEQLMLVDDRQILPRYHQLSIGRLFYGAHKSPQAAAAFEKYLRQYAQGPEHAEVRLLLGIIYARDLGQYEAAEEHLLKARDLLGDSPRRAQCEEWLEQVLALKGAGGPPGTHNPARGSA